jgi:hypothetical protein
MKRRNSNEIELIRFLCTVAPALGCNGVFMACKALIDHPGTGTKHLDLQNRQDIWSGCDRFERLLLKFYAKILTSFSLRRRSGFQRGMLALLLIVCQSTKIMAEPVFRGCQRIS